VDALKQAVIHSRPELENVGVAKVRVYHMGDACPAAAAERDLDKDTALTPDSDLRGVIGSSYKAFFLLTASLPAGACARVPLCAPRALLTPAPSLARLQALLLRRAVRWHALSFVPCSS